MVGTDDASKKLIENVLSDGAVWDNQSKGKMPFQQVLVQGYAPTKKIISEDDIINVINVKIQRRNELPEHCGLIISVYGNKGQINFQKIIDSCNLSIFEVVFCVTYKLPELGTAVVTRLEKGLSQKIFLQNAKRFSLDRFSNKGEWLIRQG